MSKIEEMTKELCPKGVKKVKLGDVCNISRGKRVVRKDLETVGKIPVFQNSLVPLGYYSKSNCPAETTFVISAGAAGVIGISDTPFWAADDCFIVESTQMEDKFIYNFLKTKEYYLQSKIRGGAIKRLAKEPLEALEIPLPPLAIQQEIVSVLDSFTTLIDKMKKEVELRKKQMEVYCDKLYGGNIEGMKALANIPGNSVIKISELGTITRGRRFVRDDIRESGQPCIHYGDMYTYYGTHAIKAKTYLDRDFPKKMKYAEYGDVVVVGAGENDYDIGVGLVWYGEEPVAVHDACYILKHEQEPMYISYYLRSNIYHQQLKQYVSSGKISSFSADGLGKVLIPIQPREKQQEIAYTLRAFEAYISKLEKLIALRQKQYEYYREKLLTFE